MINLKKWLRKRKQAKYARKIKEELEGLLGLNEIESYMTGNTADWIIKQRIDNLSDNLGGNVKWVRELTLFLKDGSEILIILKHAYFDRKKHLIGL